jgi:hypothetical protein
MQNSARIELIIAQKGGVFQAMKILLFEMCSNAQNG